MTSNWFWAQFKILLWSSRVTTVNPVPWEGSKTLHRWWRFGEHLWRECVWTMCVTSPILIGVVWSHDTRQQNAEATKVTLHHNRNSFWSETSRSQGCGKYSYCKGCSISFPSGNWVYSRNPRGSLLREFPLHWWWRFGEWDTHYAILTKCLSQSVNRA